MSKHIVITGTSRGIGYKLALQFANSGHKVLALSRNTNSLDKVNHENITTISTDLSKEDDIINAASFVEKKWSSVDVLINNAGMLIN